MSVAARKLIQTMVFEAFERFEDDVESRREFLRERCRENPDLLSLAMEESEVEDRIRKGRFMDKTAAAVFSAAIPAGTLIGDYRISSPIGEGAMGAVYKARQVSLDRDVAVKLLRTPLGTQAGQRFLSEARTLSRIASARVIHVYGYGDYAGQPYIAMEYVEGVNLAQVIAEQRLQGMKSRLLVALQIAEGLEQIHLASIAHRDVKPSNVLVDARGNVKLIDFGIAWREDARMTEAGQALGTPAYMPPEQILRHLGGSATDLEQYKRVDIYSFGILLFELFTGELPFQGETRCEVEWQIVNATVPLERLRECRVPEGVVELIRLASSKNPAARPRSVGEVSNVLRMYLEGQGSQATALRPRAKSLRLAISTGMIAASIALLAFYGLRSGNHTGATVPPPPHRSTSEFAKSSALVPAAAAIPQPPVEKTKPPAKLPAVDSAHHKQVREIKAAGPSAVQATPELDNANDAPAPLPSPPIPTAAPEPVLHVYLPEPRPAMESAEDLDWARLGAPADLAALEAYSAKYPDGKHAAEARKIAADLHYQRTKGHTDPETFRTFARKFPEHWFAATALSIASQLESRTAAAAEIRDKLERYAAAMHDMNLTHLKALRELNKDQESNLKVTLSTSRTIDFALVPVGPLQFAEPLVENPTATRQLPSHATIDVVLDEKVITRTGEVSTVKHPVTVRLNRTASGWIITSL